MRDCPYPVAELLPHAPPAVLIDAVLDWDKGRLDARVSIHVGSRFFEAERGVPGYVGIEYMAQACGAYAGLEATSSGQPVRIGFLLGTRRYACNRPWFRAGDELTVGVTEVLREGVMGVFDCRIELHGSEVATARLNVYQPDDAAAAAFGGKQDSP